MASLFVDGSGEDVDDMEIWRSLSEMDLSAMGKEAGRARQSALREDAEAEADKEVLRLGTEKEETESSDDNTTQYSIHPPFDFPYFLLLQGYNHRQVRRGGGVIQQTFQFVSLRRASDKRIKLGCLWSHDFFPLQQSDLRSV